MRSIGDIILAGFSQLKNARIENLSADPSSPSVGQIWYNTVDGVYRGFNGTAIISFATGSSTGVLLQEIDAIESAVGLSSEGGYVTPVGSNYLGSTTTLAGADAALDAALKSTADGLASEVTRATAAEGTLTTNLSSEVTRAQAAEGTLTTNLSAEVTRATAAEGTLTTNLSSEVSRATAAEGTLTTNLSSEVTRAQAAEAALTSAINDEAARATAAEGTLTTNLSAEVTRATAAESALSGRVTAVEGSYINKDGTVAYTGDQSMNSNKLTNVGMPVDNGDAANKSYVDSRISALGNAFEYVGTVEGGADAGSAFDLATLTKKQAGAYYKVVTGGYFKVGTGSAFYANVKDGVVFNTSNNVDLIDNTNSQVQGTTNFIAVSGSDDLGFVVDVDANFKGRVSTLESGLSSEISRATAAEGTLTSDLAAEVTRAKAAEGTLTTNLAAEVTRATGAEATLQSNIDAEAARATSAEGTLTTNLASEVSRAQAAEGTLTTNLAAEVSRATGAEGTLTTNLAAEVTRATGAEAALQSELDAAEAAVGLAANGTFAGVSGNYIGSASTVVGLSQALDTALKSLSDYVNASTFIYDGSTAGTSHVVAHGLGQKYCQVVVIDSADKVILADSITFDSNNQLTVSFSSAITCTVVVTR